ncbi:hypothetical protein GCM10018773_60950 [Streptomyces candidus]|nr:hypothetical protein GCM10018773_60950 [Streptomyces candidus]
MDIATIRRGLNGTLTELQRAIERFDVVVAAELFEWAWHQASQAPPRETLEQRVQLRDLKAVLGSRRWREEESRRAAQATPSQPAPGVPRPPRRTRPASAEPVPAVRPRAVGSSRGPASARQAAQAQSAHAMRREPRNPGGRSTPPVPPAEVTAGPQPGHRGLLEAGRLAEFATDLRPLLEQTARAGATTTWAALRKRLSKLPRLQREDESVLLWLVDDDRDHGEPLLSALVTVGNREMHPRFPAIAEQLGVRAGHTLAQQRSTWSWEVLKTHQYWRHRH